MAGRATRHSIRNKKTLPKRFRESEAGVLRDVVAGYHAAAPDMPRDAARWPALAMMRKAPRGLPRRI